MKILILSFVTFMHILFWIIILFKNYYQNGFIFSFSILFWILMVLIIILMVYAIRKLYQFCKLQYQMELVNEMNYLKEKQSADIELSIINEDIKIKKNLGQLKNVLLSFKNNDPVKAKNIFNELYDGLQSKESVYYCNNSYVNAILYNKKLVAEQCGIIINYEILLPEKDEMDILDLPIILFNILDNGIEASKKVTNSNIYLKIRYNDNYISIYQKNSKIKSNFIRKDNHELRMHGYGLKIVEEIVKKYDGICEWRDSGNHFESIIMFKYKIEELGYDNRNS